MNTKTTKFLAVLAVLAMAFASVAIITSADSSDATTTTVGGIKISETAGFNVSVDGDSATFVGTVVENEVYADVGHTVGFAVDVSDITSPVITKVKIIDTAFQGLEDPKDFVVYTDMDDISFPMPKDGSSVTIELYSGETSVVLEKTITLDFADAYTQVVLEDDDANSIGYDESDPPVSYWVYETDSTNSNAGVLTLNYYGGNEVFYLKNANETTVQVNGNNYLKFVAVPVDGAIAVADAAAIYSEKALTIIGEKYALLDIEVDVIKGATSGNAAGIYDAAGGIDMSDFVGKIAIDIDDTIESTSQTCYGIFADAGGVLIGSEDNGTATVDISVSGNGVGIGAPKATSSLFMNGSVSGGNVGISGQSHSANNAMTITGDDLTVSGHEAAIKTYTYTTTLNVKSLKLNLLDEGGYNEGTNPRYALTIGEGGTSTNKTYKLVVGDNAVVETYGLAIKVNKNAGEAAHTYMDISGIVKVNGYTQNPDSSLLPRIAGFYWGVTTACTDSETAAVKVYNATPTDGTTTGYMLLQNAAETYGVFEIKNADGSYAQKVISATSDLTTDKLKILKATTVYANLASNDSVLPATLTVPDWMTLILTTGANVKSPNTSDKVISTVITAGSQKIEFGETVASGAAATNEFIGKLTISKAGMEINGATKMNVASAKGSLTLGGELKTNALSIAGGSNSLAITMEDGLTISKDLTITGTKTTVTVPTDASVTVSAATKVVGFDVKGTLTANAAITVSGDAKVSGKIIGNNSDVNLALASSATVDVTGVVGYGDSTKAVKIGNATNSLTLSYATGFKMTADASGTGVSVTGTLGQYGENDAAASITGSIKSTSLTVGKGMTLTVDTAELAVNGTMTVNGIVVGGTGLSIGASKDSTLTVNGAVRGAINFATGDASATTITMITGIGTTTPDATGYTITNALSTGTVKISGKLSLTETTPEITAAQDVLEVTSGTLTMDNLGIEEFVKIIVDSGKNLKGTIVGPGEEKATFNAKGTDDTAKFTIIGGSLILTGKIANINDNTPAVTVTDGTVTFGDGETAVTLADDATVEVTGTATLELNGVFAAGTIDLKDKSELTGSSNVTGGTVNAAAGTSTDVFNDEITYVDGAYVYFTDKGVTYLCEVQTFSGKQYMAGVKLYSYTGTGVTPLTEKTIKAIAYNITDKKDGTVLGAAIKKTVADAVDVVDDAVAITVATNCVINAPVEVIPGTAKITLTVDITKATWEDAEYDKDIWALTEEDVYTSLTGKFDVSNKTDVFGDLPVPMIVSNTDVFDKWVTIGTSPVAYDPTIPMYTYTNALANTLELEATVKSISETTHVVTFDSNGGSAVASQTVKYATKATEPDAPVKADYKFVAWYTEAELVNKYNFRTAVTEDITLYAKWELDETVYASAVDVAVSKITGGVKVTVAGEGDLAVPAGTVTVKYAYWITIESTKILQWKSVDKTMTAGPIVNSVEVTGLGSAVFVEVSYVSADGEVTGSSPRIVY